MSYLLMIVCLLASVVPLQASAASGNVKATIPGFTIKINGGEVDNRHAKYPFLFYKDITYLPMTWDNLQALSLLSEWSQEEGLKIRRPYSYPLPFNGARLQQDLTAANDLQKSVTARTASYPITIEQAAIDNGEEPYPFLEYRDITYLPLTWRYIHDLLHLDIRWSESEGLSLVGGQSGFSGIIGDDRDFLYMATLIPSDPAKRVLKIGKTLENAEWMAPAKADEFWERKIAAKPNFSGKAVTLRREGDSLYYGDILAYTLTKEETSIVGQEKPVVQTVEFKADDRNTLIGVHVYWPLAVIGPGPQSNRLILIRDGKASELKQYPQIPDRVIPNADGTVWLASNRMPGRKMDIPGTGRLALIDQKGEVVMANEKLQELDVEALGLRNAGLENPAAPDGSLYVRMYGMTNDGTWTKQDTAGLYLLDTHFNAKRLSEDVQGEFYMDVNRNVYLNNGNNTVTDWTRDSFRTWYDYELLEIGQ
ncbi:hypothetical protein [Paenibacillus sp. MBLB4367]|uniref:hypothetical protein n=1 Tax=Paenibacillus sp. MBLB4367 TaxID=3384767 RepID=UPI003908003C